MGILLGLAGKAISGIAKFASRRKAAIAKKAKRKAKKLEAQNKELSASLERAQSAFGLSDPTESGLGSDQVSSSGNLLLFRKRGDVEPEVPGQLVSDDKDPDKKGFNPIWIVYGIGGLVLLKMLKVLK